MRPRHFMMTNTELWLKAAWLKPVFILLFQQLSSKNHLGTDAQYPQHTLRQSINQPYIYFQCYLPSVDRLMNSRYNKYTTYSLPRELALV